MPDIVIRGIDNDMAERIKEIARSQRLPINDVLLKLLRQSLGIDADASLVANPKQDVARLVGAWESDESDAFRAAIAAFEKLPSS